MKKTILFFILLFYNSAFCQYETIDTKMEQIPKEAENSIATIAQYISENFSSDDYKVRALYYWLTSRISYDVENMSNLKPQTSEEKIAATLKTRKGVCMHYAEVFNAIALKMNIKSVIIDGYTKQFGIIAPLAHSWNACYINNQWCLIDATWGAGYVKDNVFYKKLNNSYFLPNTKEFLKTHMPFDFLWQLNSKPINNDEFYEDIVESESISNSYDFNSEIVKFEKMTELDKIQIKIDRIEKVGLKNSFITEKYNMLKKELENYKNNSSIPKLVSIVSQYNEANNLLNEFIFYRNHRFIPLVSDDEIKKKVQIPYERLLNCEEELSKINDVSKENMPNFIALKNTIVEAKKRFEIQIQFLNQYLNTNLSERNSLFLVKKKRIK